MNVQELIDALSKVEDKTKEVIIYDYKTERSSECTGIYEEIVHPYGYIRTLRYDDDNAVELDY